jgi:hypothetical protein
MIRMSEAQDAIVGMVAKVEVVALSGQATGLPLGRHALSEQSSRHVLAQPPR